MYDSGWQIDPIEKIDLADQIISKITTMLFEGKIKPGDKLPSEREWSEQLGVSRTSLRLALKALEVLGVIDIQPGSGVYISRDNSRLLINPLKFMRNIYEIDAIELWETRRTIEVALTGLAAQKADEEDIRILDGYVEQIKECTCGSDFSDLDAKFHKAIFRIARNRPMEAVMLSIDRILHRERYELTGVIRSEVPALRDQSWRFHYELVEALKENDVVLAQEKMLEHIDQIENAWRATGTQQRLCTGGALSER
ncbi:MAG: FadR family transcriptional regulator [Lentisphaerae bacterium]|nr:FadR family transcriptional regulator [Lentisphaerota bacterium]